MRNLRRIVIRNIVILLIITMFTLSNIFAKEMGYFDIQDGTGYLGFSRMSKDFKITSLMNSAIANDAKATQIFIASGANVNEKNIAGVTALHLAARNNSYESAQILIENGAKVNEMDADGWTPLMRASLSGNEKLMKLLIDNGADLWLQNNNGETALMHTAMADCYECGKLIIDNTTTSNPMFYSQSRKSLQIVNKRYNEPFIELLTNSYNKSEELNTNENRIVKNDINKKEDDNLVHLVYIFTGKTISVEKLEKIGKSTYDISQKNQSQLKKQQNNTNEKSTITELDNENNSNTMNTKKLFIINNQPDFKQKSYSIAKPEKNSSKNDGAVPLASKSKTNNKTSNNEKINSKNERNQYKLDSTLSKPLVDEKDIDNKNNKYKLNSALSKPVIDKKDVEKKPLPKQTANKNNQEDKNNKYKLNSTLSKPVIDSKDIKSLKESEKISESAKKRKLVFDSKTQNSTDNSKSGKFKLKTDTPANEKSNTYKLNSTLAKPVIDRADLETDKNSEKKVYKISNN